MILSVMALPAAAAVGVPLLAAAAVPPLIAVAATVPPVVAALPEAGWATAPLAVSAVVMPAWMVTLTILFFLS